MSLNNQTNINKERSFFLSTIPETIIATDIICDTLFANAGFISTLMTDNLTASTLNVSTLAVKNLDVSGMYVSTIRGNTAFFSTMTFASDLSGGVGYVRFSVDASGIQVDGDPIRFDNLVYLTSTINIVQVSTIVDTDIFAQRGFFSTLSSGNFSANQASITEANISSLVVSSIQALDISGDFAKNWSQFPTLASSITFQPGNVLSNIGNKLYFAGTELTDLSGGGQDWSSFPAVQDVSFNNFSLREVSTLQYQDGATLVSQTGNNLLYNGLPVQYGATSNVSQWANYPAVNTLQTSGFPISSIGNLTLTANSNIRLLAEQISTVADNGIDITTTSKIDLTAQNGFQGQINMTANPGFQGLYGQITMTANGGTVAGVGTGGLVSITANTPLGTLCNATSAIKLSASGVNSYAGAVPSIGSLAGYNFIYGTGGVNICAGIPSIFPNVPLTTFLYGTAGVVSGADFYVPNIYPYWNGLTTPPDLQITGRYIIPNLAQVYVQLSNVKNIYMDAGAQILNARYVSTVSTVGQNANFNTGTFGTVAAGAMGASAGLFTTLEAGSISTGSVIAPLLSTTNINLSTINGLPFTDVVTPQNIVCSTITSQSSITTIGVVNFSQVSTFLMGSGLILSTTIGDLRANNIKVADDITGITNAPMPLQSRIINFSSINSFNVSTTDLWVSSINGAAPGGGGGATISSFQTLQTSSFKVSTISGTTGSALAGSTVFVEGGIQFVGEAASFAGGSRFLSSVRSIVSPGEALAIEAEDIDIVFNPGGNNYVRIGGGGAFDTKIRSYDGAGAVSTSWLLAKGIVPDPTTGLDLSGSVFVNGTVELPLATGGINFDDGSGLAYTRLMRRDVANNNMLAAVDTPGLASNNMMPLGVGEIWITPGADQYGAARLYGQFPGANFGLDMIDENGTTLFEAMYVYDSGGFNYQTGLAGVSSIGGFTAPGGAAATGFTNIVTAPTISTQNLLCSTINGAVPGGGGTVTDQFSTLFTSSFAFSTATSVGSNTNFNYPIFIDYDQAGNTTTAGVAIAVQGHNLGAGAVVNRIEMGARATGENYIMSVWPGQNLEELFIDATDLTIRDGVFSTIINLDPWGLQTTGGILGPFVSTLALNVSTINGNDPTPAYLNALTTSTMLLYSGSTTLMSLDSRTAFSNINISGYDAVVGVNGTYKIGTSFQFISPGSADEVEFFVLKNSVPISYGGGICQVQNNQNIIQYCEIVEPLINGDAIQVGCYTTGANVYASTTTGVAIVSPAMILTMYKVD